MAGAYDVFFSYRRKDLARAQPLLAALETAGVRVWRDQPDLPVNAAITEEIRRALAASKALIAFHSLDYPLSRPCQQEITAAWIAAQQMGGQPYDRVLVLNPESGFDHLPAVLREQQLMRWPREGAEFAAMAAKIHGHVARLTGTLAGAGLPATTGYYGMVAVEAARFVGRVREMWDLHGRLTADRMSIITGVVGQAAAQVRGLGGNGKTLLAREYAIRFGAAYPGGVFWLNAYGNDDAKGQLDAQAREALRMDQIAGFAERMGIPAEGRKPGEVESELWRRIEKAGRPCLWIVDDLPSGLDPGEIEKRWNAQWSRAATLITTRSAGYGALGQHLDLNVLSEAEALRLLTARREPGDPAEQEAARRIAAELGYHPLAIEVAGSYLAKGIQNFSQYRDELLSPDRDAVEFGANLRESLPTGHERSISGTLLKSIRQLGSEGRDFLQLASVLAVAPIPMSFLEMAFAEARLTPLHRFVALARKVFGRAHGNERLHGRALRALDQADSLGLCTKARTDARLVHTLVSRTMRYHSGSEGRTRVFRAAAVRALTAILPVVADIRRHSEVVREMVHARHIVSGTLATREETVAAAWVATHDFEKGDYGGAHALQEQVLEARRRLLGDEHPDTLTAINHLALTVKRQGDLGAARGLRSRCWSPSGGCWAMSTPTR